MLVSMTGFCTRTATVGQETEHPLELTLTVKALNGRFLEVNCKLPYALTHLETEIIKRFKMKLIRGTVYVTIQVSNPNALKANLVPAFTIVENYIGALSAMQERFKLPGNVTVSDLIHLPNIFEFPELLVDQETAREIVTALDKCADDLIKTRLEEGALLEKDISHRLQTLTQMLGQLEERVVVALQERKDAMLTQVGTLFQEVPSEVRDQQIQLLQMQLNRHEINEEIVRFAAHLGSFKAVMSAPDYEKGKKLDFINQELFREINTIGSKAINADIGNLAISMKVELEKIREQLQNIV